MEQRTAVYLRVSTDKQSNGIESQERALRSYLKNNDIDDFQIFRDESISGAKASRPQLDQMMEGIAKGQYNCVLVYSFSRFARSTSHLLKALEKFNSLNVSFISLTESLNTASPMGKAVFVIISALSELERDLISERVRNGLANAKAKGKRLGAPRRRNGELIRSLAEKGLRSREIAKLAGCSHSTVNRELREWNTSKQDEDCELEQ